MPKPPDSTAAADSELQVPDTVGEGGAAADQSPGSVISMELGARGGDWRAWIFPLAALLVCLAGAGRELWSLGLAMLAIGATVILAPPARHLPWLAAAPLVVFLVAPLGGFLPAEWMSADAGWRQQLVAEWQIPLGKSVSPQPAVTFESWLVLACLVVWLWTCLGQGFTENQRRLLIRILALGGSIVALLSVLEFQNVIEMPWWPRNVAWGTGFGPFSNRNHTSGLCAITAMLSVAAAYDAFRNKSPMGVVHVLTFVFPLAAIFVNTSRSGLVLLFAGIMAWLATASLRRGFFKKLAIFASLVFVAFGVVIALGGSLAKRLGGMSAGDLVTKEARFSLYQEVLAMCGDSPWLGAGLGNFNYVYPLVSTLHEPRMRFLHPESDLMWLLAEGGLLAVLPVGALFIWWLGTSGPWFGRDAKTSKGRTDRRLRKAAAIGAMLALGHGLVDVPNHGVGYAMFTSVLLAAAVAPRKLQEVAKPWQTWGARGLALAVAALGIGALMLPSRAMQWPLASSAGILHEQAIKLASSSEHAKAQAMVDRAIQLTPLEFRLYYLRAQLKLASRRPSEEALEDFGRARTVEPHYARFCYDEGLFWLGYDPPMAIIPWREYLRRFPESGPGAQGFYGQMLWRADPYPEIRKELWKLATSPALKLHYLESAPPGEEWNRALAELLAPQPDLKDLSPEERVRLFAVWQARGDRDQLLAGFERHPRWKDHGWRILVEEFARKGRFKDAYETIVAHLPKTRSSALANVDLGTLERQFTLNPLDPRHGLELYYAQRARGQLDAALVTLEKVARMPNAPAVIFQEMASVFAVKEDYRRAWEIMQQALARLERE